MAAVNKGPEQNPGTLLVQRRTLEEFMESADEYYSILEKNHVRYSSLEDFDPVVRIVKKVLEHLGEKPSVQVCSSLEDAERVRTSFVIMPGEPDAGSVAIMLVNQPRVAPTHVDENVYRYNLLMRSYSEDRQKPRLQSNMNLTEDDMVNSVVSFIVTKYQEIQCRKSR